VSSSSSSSSSSNTSSGITCDYCGLSFNSHEEKEEHIKLEHSEHKQPTGVA
jgi:hypothetical protein